MLTPTDIKKLKGILATKEDVKALEEKIETRLPLHPTRPLTRAEAKQLRASDKNNARAIERALKEPISPDDTLSPQQTKQLYEARREINRGGGTPWADVKKKLKL